MKKLLLLISAAFLFSCDKKNEPTPTPATPQTKLVRYLGTSSGIGTFRYVNVNGDTTNGGHNTFSVSFNAPIGFDAWIEGKGQMSTLIDGNGNVIGYSQDPVSVYIYQEGIEVSSNKNQGQCATFYKIH